MGRKRKRTTKASSKKRINIDLAIVTLIMLSILLFVLIYGEKGAIGEVLSPMLGGIVGFIKYLIPIGTLALAISMARDDKNYIISKEVASKLKIYCCGKLLSNSDKIINTDMSKRMLIYDNGKYVGPSDYSNLDFIFPI